MQQHSSFSFQKKCILIATILASGMAFLDGSVVTIAIPALQASLHASLADVQWVVNGYSLLLCALILVSGALGDRFGRKKIFLIGIGVFVFASTLCSIAQTIEQLVVFRFLQGVGGAMMVPGSLSIIDVSFSSDIRGRAIGIWSGFSGGVAALGPFVGGALVQFLGWQYIFLLNIPLGVLAFVLTLRFVPETKNDEATQVDLIGTVLIFLSLLGITYGLIIGPDAGWQHISVWGSLLAGSILFLLFIYIEKIRKEPLVPFHMFRSSLVTGANIATLFLYFALSGIIFFFVLNLQQIQHYSPILTGFAILPTILIITFFSSIGGSIADTFGPRMAMIIGPLLVSLGMFSLLLPGLHAHYYQFLPGLLLFGSGMALVIAPLTKSALYVEKKYSGAASGVNNAVARLAGLLAVALLGAIVLSFFEKQLPQMLAQSSFTTSQQHDILLQQNKLGGIVIPHSFTAQAQKYAQGIIDSTFLYGFRIATAVCASLAFLSSVVAFLFIHTPKRK